MTAAASINPNKIITPATMKRVIIAGGNNISVNKAQIDALNVFPVPDGDTGTNMSLTMSSVIAGLNADTCAKMDILSNIVSKGALKGARGNSGVILSQILRGFCNEIAKVENVDTRTFAKAMKSGTTLAYSAVSVPREGTILTVIRVMSEKALEISKYTSDFEDFFNKLIVCGEDILAQTPEMLDVLKKAGVVDSGGFGLVIFFKGLLAGFLNQEVSVATDVKTETTVTENSIEKDAFGDGTFIDYHSLDDIQFAYCTEFFVTNLYKKTTLTGIDKLREYLNEIGDSVVVVGDLDLVKVHVHTNEPGKALSFALKLGELDKLKIENMLEQNRQLKAKLDAERKYVGALSICAGKGFSGIFKDLMVDQITEGGQTMNPSADEIAASIKRINAENVIVLPNNKNIILAAEQSRGLIENKNVYVIPTTNIPQGISAMLAFDPEAKIPDLLQKMNDAINHVVAGSVTYAVRNSTIGNLKLKIGDKIALAGGDIVAKGKAVDEVTIDLLSKMVTEDTEMITLYYGADVSEEEATTLQNTLTETYPNAEVCMFYGGQPLYYYIVSVE